MINARTMFNVDQTSTHNAIGPQCGEEIETREPPPHKVASLSTVSQMLGPISRFVAEMENKGIYCKETNTVDNLIFYSAPVGYKIIFYEEEDRDQYDAIVVHHIVINEQEEEGSINDVWMFDLYVDDVELELVKCEVIV